MGKGWFADSYQPKKLQRLLKGRTMAFTTVITEGNLIPADLLEQIAAGEAAGQTASDFGLAHSLRLTDEIAAAWSEIRDYWKFFQLRLRRLPEADAATTLTRDWVKLLLEPLGYATLTYMPNAAVVNGRTYAISHRAGSDESAPPVHIEGIRRKLNERSASGKPRLSPHALMQEYLNSTEHLWGIVTNGEKLRLLRDSSRTTRPTFVEFDLRAMLDGEKFSEFALLYRLLHRSRLPLGMDDAPKCLLEKYHQQAIEAGGRVRDGLRDGVENALRVLGKGFLHHPDNTALRQRLQSGEVTALNYYRQLLRLVYRLLFLMVAEERGLIAGTETGLTVYTDYYSVTRLRHLVESLGSGRGRYSDLWAGLLATFRILEDDTGAEALGLTALDGDLFGPDAINKIQDTHLYNADLVAAICALSLYHDPQSKAVRRVNYAALDVEELGSVYEGLLDYRPVIIHLEGTEARSNLEDTSVSPSLRGEFFFPSSWDFELVTGTERKTTGSYYTRPELVHELIVSALEPVLADRLTEAGSDQAAREEAILNMTVCDPACGSDHFLLAAARRLGRELARVRTGEEQPAPEQFRRAVRDVIGRCIYGVDANPLAVDLCKLALWIEGHNAGMPLSFLDSHIRWGNSLIGARPDLMEVGIPDEAFQAVTGDDKAVATLFRKRNQRERENRNNQKAFQVSMVFDSNTSNNSDALAGEYRQLDATPDSSVKAVRSKAATFANLREQAHHERSLYNLWTAAFFMPLTKKDDATIPTTETFFQFKNARNSIHALAVGRADALSQEMGFFHWELEFPQVFNHKGGFDVVLGNPPWERIKLQEQEHWVDDPYISKAANKAERDRCIAEYRNSPEPAKQVRIAKFEAAKYRAEAESRFIRASGRFALTAVGDVNTYALFAEHDRNLVNTTGRAGIIVPTGIATDDTCKQFFGDLTQKQTLVSLYDIENREKLFAAIDSRMKFSLLTMGRTTKPTNFVFFATNPAQLQDKQRVFNLTQQEIALFNPNTLTCPVFRTKADAELIKKIYRRVPVMENEHTKANPWDISFLRMFDITNDSHLFQTQNTENFLPLYEGNIISSYDHRFASYNREKNEYQATNNRNLEFVIDTQYFVPEVEVVTRVRNKVWKREWFFGVRRVASNTNMRTLIGSVTPYTGVSYGLYLIFSDKPITQVTTQTP